MFEIGVPQMIWLAISFSSIAYAVAHEGQEKKPSKHNATHTVIGTVLGLGLLYWGGFFG